MPILCFLDKSLLLINNLISSKETKIGIILFQDYQVGFFILIPARKKPAPKIWARAHFIGYTRLLNIE